MHIREEYLIKWKQNEHITLSYLKNQTTIWSLAWLHKFTTKFLIISTWRQVYKHKFLNDWTQERYLLYCIYVFIYPSICLTISAYTCYDVLTF